MADWVWFKSQLGEYVTFVPPQVDVCLDTHDGSQCDRRSLHFERKLSVGVALHKRITVASSMQTPSELVV